YDSVEAARHKTSVSGLEAQFIGMVKKRVHEVLRMVGGISVLAIFQVLIDDVCEARVLQKPPAQAIHGGREAGYPNSKENAAGLEHASRFHQSAKAILSIDQMIQRAEEQNCVGGLVIPG